MVGRPVADGGVVDCGGLYQTPWALSEKCFLVSYSYARPNCTAPAGADSNGFAIYLIDTYGNRELIHRDPLLSCTFPIPLRKRPRPTVVPDLRTPQDRDATYYVADVYRGLEGVPRGTIRYLRISQHVGWPFDDRRGQKDYIPGNAGSRRIDFQSWSPVRVIGTVPVESDGSACFRVPADTGIYFQALDERYMEIRRMRSVVSLKAGEVRGCTGCHESRGWTPNVGLAIPKSLRPEPTRPTPPPWGSQRLLGYEWLVQPILDRHCVQCHGRENPDGGIDLTATRADDGLYQSFRTMFGQLPGEKKTGRVLVSCSDRFSNAEVSKTKQFGSHKSPLVQVLLKDSLHREKANLSDREWISLVTWIDANAPYHDAFLNKRPADGGPPRRIVTLQLRSPLAGTNAASSHEVRNKNDAERCTTSSTRKTCESIVATGGAVMSTDPTDEAFGAFGDVQDWLADPSEPSRVRAASWHRAGAGILRLDSDSSNLAHVRRYRGMVPYQAHYDGVLGIAPASSPAAVAARADLDDVRYATLLRLLAERAIKRGGADRELAREALLSFETNAAIGANLDTMRLEAIGHILELAKIDDREE